MVVLYSIGCPQCEVLEKRLRRANIDYILNDNRVEMECKRYIVLPVLEVDGNPLTFTEAIAWIKEQEEHK